MTNSITALLPALGLALLASCDSDSSDAAASASPTSTPTPDTSTVCQSWRAAKASSPRTLSAAGENVSDTFSIRASDGSLRQLTLSAPTAAATGTNSLAFRIANGSVVDSGWTVTFVPTMPSMGHSSPNNIQPVYASGLFSGTVNFTMSGDWRIYFCLESRDGSLVDTSHFIDLSVSE